MRWISIDAESHTVGISFDYDGSDSEELFKLLREGKIFSEWNDIESEDMAEFIKLIPELKKLKESEE